MSDNVLQTLQTLVQDVVAPDVRELKVKVDSLEKRIDSFEKHMDSRFSAMDKQLQATEKTLLAAIGQLKAQNELATMSAVAELRERVAVLESKRN